MLNDDRGLVSCRRLSDLPDEPPVNLGQGLVAAGAGLAAGAINAAAGGGTLIAFPALLAVGVGRLEANIACSVGLLSGYAGGSLAYRRELAGQAARLRLLAPAGILGGAAGALILLATPASSFAGFAPFLILVACALLGAQPWLARRLAARAAGGPPARRDRAALAGVLVAGVYGSYFGAGLGVLLLGVLGLVLADGLQRLNALKGLLSLVSNVAGVVVLVASGRVAWPYAGALAAGAALGGTLGVSLARRLPAHLLRGGVVVLGVAVALVLLL